MVITGLVQRWLKRAVDPDQLLITAMASVMDVAALRYALENEPARYRPGQPLKLLLPTYCGTRNTGADVRVAEIVEQLKRIVGEEQVELTLFTIDPEKAFDPVVTAMPKQTLVQVTKADTDDPS